MNIDAVTASLIGVIIGSVSGISGALISTLISRRSDERKHLRDLAVTTAIKNWERMQIDADRLVKAGHSITRMPLDIYLIHMVMLIEAVTKPKWNEKDIEKEIIRIHKVVDMLGDKIMDIDKNKPGQQGAL